MTTCSTPSPRPTRIWAFPSLLALGLTTTLWSADAPPIPAGAPEWINVTSNLADYNWGFSGVCAMAAVPGSDAIIAGISEKGLWSSADGGKVWLPIGKDGDATIKNRPYQIIFDPKDANIFWVSGNFGAGVFQTTDGGKVFKPLGKLENVDGLAVDFSDPKRRLLLIGMHEQERSLQKSASGGSTWSKIGAKLPDNSNFSANPLILDSKVWLVSCAGFKKDKEWGTFRSEDAGSTWAKVSPEGSLAPALVTSGGAIFWSVGYGDALMRSTDKGKTWIKLKSPAKAVPAEMAKGWIVAAGEQQLYVSSDNGDNWAPVCPALPFKPTGIVYAAKRNCLYCWHTTEKTAKDAIMRCDLPEDLDGLIAAAKAAIIARDVMVWNGDEFSKGNGWVDPKAGPSVKAQSQVVKKGSGALQFHGEGGAYASCGWNWQSWYPAGSGVDTTALGNLVFAIKVDGTNKPNAIKIHLGSSTDKGFTGDVQLDRYCPKFADGEWHDVVIPLADLYGANTAFDQKKVWEIDISGACTGKASFDVYVDEIGFNGKRAEK